MLLPKFEFFEPTFTAEAREIMVRYGANARVLAGGTDLLVNMKKSPAAGTVGMPGRIEVLEQTDGNNGMPATVSCCAEAEIAALHNQSKEMLIVGRGVKVTPLIRILPTSPEMPVRPVRQGAVIER